MQNGDVISWNTKVADSFLRRFIGLMGRKHLVQGEGMLLSPCRQIHTFFMRITIDAVFLDRNGTILEVIPEMKPGRISPCVKAACHVLELPQGTVKKFKLEKSQTIDVLFS